MLVTMQWIFDLPLDGMKNSHIEKELSKIVKNIF